MTPVRRLSGLTRLAGLLLAALVVGSVAAGCSSGSASIVIADPWVRNSPAVAGAGAAYMRIENSGSAADALVGVSSPAATTAEVHETYVIESAPPSASDGMGGSGEMMGMRPIARLDIPAGGTVELKPGGYHIMLMNLTRELKPGDKIEITLKFEEAGEIKITAEVRES